jgi:hypothetical protein
MYTLAGDPTRSWIMSLSSHESVGRDRHPKPGGIWRIVFSSPVANWGLRFTIQTA